MAGDRPFFPRSSARARTSTSVFDNTSKSPTFDEVSCTISIEDGVGLSTIRRPTSMDALNLVYGKVPGISSSMTLGTEYVGILRAEGFRPMTNAEVSNTRTFVLALSERSNQSPLSEALGSSSRTNSRYAVQLR